MHSNYKYVLSSVMLLMTGSVIAETPAEIFAKMDERKRASYAGINDYTLKKTVMGLCSIEHYEKAQTESADGRGMVEYMRLVPLSEVAERSNADSPIANASAADLERAATELRAMGPQADSLFREKVQETGLPGGIGTMIMNPPPDQPWLSANPKDMLNSYAMMLDGAAAGKRQNQAMEAEARTEAMTDPLAAAADKTRVVGRESIGNRPAIHLITEDINQTQSTNGQDFTLKTMHLWVDADKYVPLKMEVEGTATDSSGSRDLKIERVDAYQAADNCGSMYEPFRSQMSVAGIMTPEEEQQMAEAAAQLEEAKAQLDALPESQKAMIMKQLGPQMKMLEGLASGKGIEIISLVTAMRCNAGLPSMQDYQAAIPGTEGASICYGFSE